MRASAAGNITKAALIAAVADSQTLTKKLTGEVLEDLFARIRSEVLAGGRVYWPGFGTFTLRHRKARRIRNPQTNELMQLPRKTVIGFRAAKTHR